MCQAHFLFRNLRGMVYSDMLWPVWSGAAGLCRFIWLFENPIVSRRKMWLVAGHTFNIGIVFLFKLLAYFPPCHWGLSTQSIRDAFFHLFCSTRNNYWNIPLFLMDFFFFLFFLQHPLLSGRPFSYQHVGGSLLSRNYSRTIVPPKNFSRFLTTAQSSTSNPSPERTGNNFHTSAVYAYQVLSETSGVPTPSVQSCLTVNGHDEKKGHMCTLWWFLSFSFTPVCFSLVII